MLTARAAVKFGSPHRANGSHVTEPEYTEDAILGGRVRVRQPARGYRVNVDTILLAAALPSAAIRSGTRVVELGCGVGAALISLAVGYEREGDVRFVGIERDPIYAALAKENAALNAQAHRVEIMQADGLDPAVDFGVFDYVLFNPPYDRVGEGRPPAEGKKAAFVADRPVGDWIKVWSNKMGAGAAMTLIQRAQRLNEILSALEGRLGGAEIFPVRPNANAKASRVIVRAWKGSRAPLKLLRGLDLHPMDGSKDKYTPEAEAILRGETPINFG